MTVIHTISQAFIVKEPYDDVIRAINELNEEGITGAAFEATKLIRAKTSEAQEKHTTITILVDMVVAVEKGPDDK